MNPKIAFLIALCIIVPVLPSGAADGAGCAECHNSGSGDAPSVKIPEESVHAVLDCSGCHRGVEFPHDEQMTGPVCGTCHGEEKSAYEEGYHGGIAGERARNIPACTSCHGSHDILPVDNRKSPVSRLNIIALCVDCHTDEEAGAGSKEGAEQSVSDYTESVHAGVSTEAGMGIAAVCTDCHGAHNLSELQGKECISISTGPILSATCCKCHEAERENYAGGIHGKAAIEGNTDVPYCTDCHGEHGIKRKEEKGGVSERVVESCSNCHEDRALADKYDMPGKRYSTYLYSYHGVANKYGRTVVADCSSCHGYHKILPASDPESRIHPSNLAQTCGECHPGAGENFLKGKMHVEASREGSFGVWLVRNFYIWFIGTLMVLFIVYMVLDIRGSIKSGRKNAGK